METVIEMGPSSQYLNLVKGECQLAIELEEGHLLARSMGSASQLDINVIKCF